MDTDRYTGTNRQQAPARPPRIGGLAPDLASLADVIDQLYTDFASALDLSAVVATRASLPPRTRHHPRPRPTRTRRAPRPATATRDHQHPHERTGPARR